MIFEFHIQKFTICKPFEYSFSDHATIIMIRPLLVTLLTFVCLNGKSQSADRTITADATLIEKVDTYLRSASNAHQFNGVALVEQKGKIILHKAFGWQDFAAKTLNDTATKFPILSITKSFTATILIRLQELGRLSLKDSLTKYFPEYPDGGAITLEHLLTHSSGIYNYTNNIDEADSAVVCHPVSRDLVMDQFKNKPLAFRPGTGFSYSNSGYYLAGMIIEKVTGKPYEQNVRELIFEPLGMTRSGFDYINLPKHERAVGYQFLNSNLQKRYPFYDSTVGYAAGSIYSTTGDLLKWVHAIGSAKLLSSDSWKEAFISRGNGYGYGFQIGNYEKKSFIRHAGGYPGFTSEYLYYPKEEITIILLRNTGNYGQDLWPIASDLSKILFHLPYERWTLQTPVTLTEELLKEKEGTYTFKTKKLSFIVMEQQLRVINTLGMEIPLLATHNNFFYSEIFYTEFLFVKDRRGEIAKVIVNERGVPGKSEWRKER